ncbi:hypothetical protein PENSPDRAFT_756821 [Peniophora sp. CONT]|nr:hypothetical protein PENSPDRAFT_756821 [Peniophora sp. CONT]
MEGKWYGPVPVDRWKKDFAPRKSKELVYENISFADMGSTTEGDKPFVDAITSSKVLEKLKLYCKDTHKLFGRDKTIDGSDFKFGPDVCFLGTDMPMTAADEERLERLIGEILCFGDLKSKNGHDPCLHITSASDRAKLYLKNIPVVDSDMSFKVRGQFIAYARAICANSHRTHLYGFVVLPNHARLLYFDQSGVCYSELFEWRTTPHLSEFLQLFGAASDVRRGIDTSVEKISTKDELVADAETIFCEAKASDSLPDGVEFKTVFETFKSDSATYWRCNVYDDRLKIFHRVLTYRVHSSTPYFAGRASRGFIAVDLDRRAVIYMKRSWRINLPSFPKERDTYHEFAEAGVPHLPDCYFGGDVPRHSGELAKKYFEWKKTAPAGATWVPSGEKMRFVHTKVSTYIDKHGEEDELKEARRGATGRTDLTDDDIEMLPHALTVTLFGKVGGRLRDFKSSRQLCIALMHALETHEAAYRLKKVLHRDISAGNILIYKVPGGKGEIEGLLIDWDLCVNVELVREARRKGRTGTWEFMSARMLKDPKGCVHEVRDDLESMCYLLHHHVLRYRDTVPVHRKALLCSALRDIFNRVDTTNLGRTGGNHKLTFIRGTFDIVEEAIEAVSPSELHQLLEEARRPFTKIYAVAPRPNGAIPNPFLKVKRSPALEHAESVEEGVQMCTHEYMLYFFRTLTAPDIPWLDDRPADDQYPLHVREDFVKGKAIEHHYVVTEAGVASAHDASSRPGGVSMKRKASSTLSYYTSGSGYSLKKQRTGEYDPSFYSDGSDDSASEKLEDVESGPSHD